MTVNELIAKLELVEDKTKSVEACVGWECVEIDEVVVNDDCVLLGNDIPPEMYERDYKYER